MTIDRLFEQVIEYRKRGWNCGDQMINIRKLLKKGESSEIVYKQIKNSIEENNFDNFKFFIEEFEEYGISLEELRKEGEEKLQIQLDSWLEEECKEMFKHKEDISFLLVCGAKKEIIYEQMKNSIEENHFDSFKFFVEEFGFSIEQIIQKDKYKNGILKWFKYYCNKYFNSGENRYLTYINFLLNLSKRFSFEFELIYEQMMDDNNCKHFIFLIEHSITYEQIVKDMKDCNGWGKKLIRQLNVYLEKEYCLENKDKMKILLDYGANNIGALKEAIIREHFVSFRKIVEEDRNLLEELRKEETNLEQILQNRLNNWLKKELKSSYNYIHENLIFLISLKEIKIKINNEVLIKELIEYIYEENGLESRTLENKIMRPEKFDEETKKLIIEIVSRTHPERANILKIRLNLK